MLDTFTEDVSFSSFLSFFFWINCKKKESLVSCGGLSFFVVLKGFRSPFDGLPVNMLM